MTDANSNGESVSNNLLRAASEISVPAPFAAVADFAISSLVAIFSFLSIYLAALVLANIIHQLNKALAAAEWLAGVAEFVERVLVYADVGLLMVFLTFEILRYVRGQIREFVEE